MKKTIISCSILFASSFLFSQQIVTEKWENGQTKLEGLFNDKVLNAPGYIATRAEKYPVQGREGQWNYWYANGIKKGEEFYANGLASGIWKAWYESGKLNSEIDFKSGKAIYFYQSGKIQGEGTMLNDMKRDGTWIGYFENGNKNYTGSYKNGKQNGEWIWYSEKGEVTLKENYVEGVKQK